MEKPNSLRAALTSAVPYLARDPDLVTVWVEQGRIRSPMVENRGFAWEYTLNVTVTNLTLHPSYLFLAINDWLRVNQPDLLKPEGSAGYAFDADIIDPQTVDLHIKLRLTENVALVAGPNGPMLQHLAEPDLTWLTGRPLTEPPVPLEKVTPMPGTNPIPLGNPAA